MRNYRKVTKRLSWICKSKMLSKASLILSRVKCLLRPRVCKLPRNLPPFYRIFLRCCLPLIHLSLHRLKDPVLEWVFRRAFLLTYHQELHLWLQVHRHLLNQVEVPRLFQVSHHLPRQVQSLRMRPLQHHLHFQPKLRPLYQQYLNVTLPLHTISHKTTLDWILLTFKMRSHRDSNSELETSMAIELYWKTRFVPKEQSWVSILPARQSWSTTILQTIPFWGSKYLATK